MSNILSRVRMKMRKHKFIFAILRRLHIWLVAIKKFPHWVKIVSKDTATINSCKDHTDSYNWLINIPNHANLGDQAMAYAERRLLSEQFPETRLVELSREVLLCQNKTMLRRLKRAIKRNDVIWVQGGYTSCNLTPNEKVHRFIASNFDNRIIFFPQTVRYTSEEERNKTAKIYNKHANILFLARDKVSYGIVKDAFSNIDVRLYPDIVSSLIGREKVHLSNERNGILLCIREDGEKFYDQRSIDMLRGELSQITQVDCSDLMIGKAYQTPEAFHATIDKLIEKISNYSLVITDRFHGILFSIIAETRVIAIDSVDYKVREGAMMFSKMINGSCYYSGNLINAVNLARQLVSEDNPVQYKTVCYDRYYQNFGSYRNKGFSESK